jgi:hypothetical protein
MMTFIIKFYRFDDIGDKKTRGRGDAERGRCGSTPLTNREMRKQGEK